MMYKKPTTIPIIFPSTKPSKEKFKTPVSSLVNSADSVWTTLELAIVPKRPFLFR